MIFYTSGLKRENFPPKTEDRQLYSEEIDRLNPLKWMVRSDGNRFSQPKLAPTAYRITRVDHKGRIWAKQNVEILEEEPEVATYYQLKINKL